MLKRLQASMVLALLLLGVIVWIALGMTSFSASPAAG
jgi:hypothetical protein